MIDVRTEVGQALISNANLINLLGGDHIYQIRAPDANQFPRITFFEMSNFDSDYADDNPIATEVHMQIDIWCKVEQASSVPSLLSEVNKAMRGAGFVRTATSPDLVEDARVFHKGLRYKIKREC